MEEEKKSIEVADEKAQAEFRVEKVQPEPAEETQESKEQALIEDLGHRIGLMGSYLSKENFMVSQIPVSFRNLDQAIPQAAQMKRTVVELFQNEVRPLVREITTIGDDLQQLKLKLKSAKEVTPALSSTINDFSDRLNRLSRQTQQVLEAVTNTISRIQRWAEEGMTRKILDARGGDEIINTARRLKMNFEKLKEENIDSSRILARRAAETIDEFVRLKVKSHAQP